RISDPWFLPLLGRRRSPFRDARPQLIQPAPRARLPRPPDPGKDLTVPADHRLIPIGSLVVQVHAHGAVPGLYTLDPVVLEPVPAPAVEPAVAHLLLESVHRLDRG